MYETTVKVHQVWLVSDGRSLLILGTLSHATLDNSCLDLHSLTGKIALHVVGRTLKDVTGWDVHCPIRASSFAQLKPRSTPKSSFWMQIIWPQRSLSSCWENSVVRCLDASPFTGLLSFMTINSINVYHEKCSNVQDKSFLGPGDV